MTEVTFFGEQFQRNEDVSEFAIMEFAEALTGGVEAGTIEGLAVSLRMFKECIAEADRDRAVRLARSKRASSEQMFEVIAAVILGRAERPTGQSSDSSDGLPNIEPKSESNSDDKGSVRFTGRPDLQLAAAKSA